MENQGIDEPIDGFHVPNDIDFLGRVNAHFSQNTPALAVDFIYRAPCAPSFPRRAICATMASWPKVEFPSVPPHAKPARTH